MTIEYTWRAAFTNAELTALHAQAFGYDSDEADDTDWWRRVNTHSLGWVCARRGGELVGFVNVAWDGGSHAFLLDTAVAIPCRHAGVGTALVAEAVRGARAARCRWLHVDFEPHLRGFYLRACGLRPTDAGLLDL